MSPTLRFLDTNVLVYAFAKDVRSSVALSILNEGGIVSVQCLNEFANVMRGRMAKPWPYVHDALDQIADLCPAIVPLDRALHQRGMAIAERFGVHVYDAMIIAAAFEAGCDTLLSEDMQDDLVVEGKLRIVNPFR